LFISKYTYSNQETGWIIKSNNSEFEFNYLDIIIVLFVLLLVLSDIASSVKIIDWGFNLGPVKL